MKLKPRTTVLNRKALVYKRYTQIEKSITKKYIYLTIQDGYLWYFDNEKVDFIRLEIEDTSGATIIEVANDGGATKFEYLDKVFFYTHSSGWVKQSKTDSTDNLGRVYSSNIGQYQVNRYYFNGAFDYIVKGSITGSTTQYIKGNIVPTQSLNIIHYNDYVDLKPDDLVIIEGKLFVVESSEQEHKHQPKEYKIYYAALNNIL